LTDFSFTDCKKYWLKSITILFVFSIARSITFVSIAQHQLRSTGTTSDIEQSSCWPSSPRHFRRNIQTQTEAIFVCSV